MRETILSMEVVSIDRIQNEFLWEKYCHHKERMSRKGSERVNEKELFHGSSSIVKFILPTQMTRHIHCTLFLFGTTNQF